MAAKMKNEKKLKNKIDYWRRHQELDKFNYNFISSYHTSIMAILIALFLPSIIYFLDREDPIILFRSSIQSAYIAFILILTFLISVLICLYFLSKRQKDHNRSFRIRESMLRVWYNQNEMGVDTGELDEVFENIKCIYKKELSNKDLKNLAKNFILSKKKNEKS